METNFAQSFELVLKSEGGFVNNPKDPGGMTNLGCTKRVWEAFVGHAVTEADMRALLPADVQPIYKTNYWDAVNCDHLPLGLDYVVFDCSINSGPVRAAKILQGALQLPRSGSVDTETLAAANAADRMELIQKYQETRLAFLHGLSTWDDFGRGWSNRVASVQVEAQWMA